MMRTILSAYFPDLSSSRIETLLAMKDIYAEWNTRINVISRKDIDNFYIHHLLHSLSIARIISFTNESRIIDVGTGGGFPGMPLAVMFPDASFTLVDSIKKKTLVAQTVAKELNIDNVRVVCERAENLKKGYDFVISRAVTAFPRFVNYTRHLVDKQGNNSLKNGILYLKGGNMEAELGKYFRMVKIYRIDQYFSETFFSDKKIVYLPV